MKTIKAKCLLYYACGMPWILRLLLSGSILMMGLQQTMGQQRTPIPERDIQMPEFYGLYAVDKGKTVSVHGETFSPMVEFLHFSKSPGAVELYQLRTQQPAPVRQPGGRLLPPPDYDPGFLRGIPSGSVQLELLKKPVSNKPEMVRVMATGRLAPGRYQITAQDLKNWFVFSVEGNPNDPGRQNPSTPQKQNETQTQSPEEGLSECVNNLRQVNAAIEQWALEKKKRDGDTVIVAEMQMYLRGGRVPNCPSGGRYFAQPVGKVPICSIPSHSLSLPETTGRIIPSNPSISEAQPKPSQNEEAEARLQKSLNNAKNIGLALRIWATGNADRFPPNLLVMTNELSTPKILFSPLDNRAFPEGSDSRWESAFANPSYISYIYIEGLDETQPSKIVVFEKIAPHKKMIPVVFCDGSVKALPQAEVAQLVKQQTGRTVEEWQSSARLKQAERALSASIAMVCPKGKIGEFKHGTKCTGFYAASGPDGKLTLVDIQLANKDSAKPYTKTKSLVHPGIDIVATEGSEIYSVADGTVDDVILNSNDENFASLGYAVVVEHEQKLDGKPTYSLYLHMKEKPKVKVGQKVKSGQSILGLVGSTGAASGPYVHFEIRHFPGRFNAKWKNVFGIERPKDEATFVESEFISNWLNPENRSSGIDAGISVSSNNATASELTPAAGRPNAANSSLANLKSEARGTALSLPRQPPPQRIKWADAMKAEEERVNRFDGSIKQQLIDLFLDAQAKQKIHRWVETAATCEKVLSIDPENHFAHSMSGNAYARLDQFELAEKHISKAIQLMPADFSTYLARFLVYARKGETNAAVAALETAIKNGSPTAYLLRQDTDVPDNFKQLPKFKELTAVSLDRIFANDGDAGLFENRTKDLQLNYDAAWSAVEKALKDQKETTRLSDKENGLVITELTAHGLFGRTHDQYFIVLERSGDATSRLSFKLLTYNENTDDSGKNTLKPESKPFIENRSKKFLDNVNKAATKKK